MDDRQLTALLRRLETDATVGAPLHGGAIDRAFSVIEAERLNRGQRRVGRIRSFPGRIQPGFDARAVWAVALISLLAGAILGGLLVAGTFHPRPPLVRVTPVTPAETVALPGRPYSITRDGGVLWVAAGNRIERVQSGRAPVTVVAGTGKASVGVGGAGVWVASSGDNVVHQLDPLTNTFGRPVTVAAPEFVAVGATDVWVSSPTTGKVVRIDAATGTITASILVGDAPGQPVLAFGSTWIPHDCIEGTPHVSIAAVSQIDPRRNEVVGTLPGYDFACIRSLAVSDGTMWYADAYAGTVTEFDPATGAVIGTIDVGERAAGVVRLGNRLWVTYNPSGSSARIARIDIDARKVDEILDLGLGPERSTKGLTTMVGDGSSLWVLADFAGAPAALRIDPSG